VLSGAIIVMIESSHRRDAEDTEL